MGERVNLANTSRLSVACKLSGSETHKLVDKQAKQVLLLLGLLFEELENDVDGLGADEWKGVVRKSL